MLTSANICKRHNFAYVNQTWLLCAHACVQTRTREHQIHKVFWEWSHLWFAVALPHLNSHCAHSRLIWNAQPSRYLISSLSPSIKSYRSSSLWGMNREIWISLCFLMSCTHYHTNSSSNLIATLFPSTPHSHTNLDEISILFPINHFHASTPHNLTSHFSGLYFPLYLCESISCECDQRLKGSSLVQRRENGGEPDLWDCIVIFCECSLSAILRSVFLAVSTSGRMSGSWEEQGKWKDEMCGEDGGEWRSSFRCHSSTSSLLCLSFLLFVYLLSWLLLLLEILSIIHLSISSSGLMPLPFLLSFPPLIADLGRVR